MNLTLLALCSLLSMSIAHAQDVDKLAWMTGNWIQRSAAEDVQENWLGPKANLMVATNLTARAGRTSTFEFLRIAMKDGKVVYFASPGGRLPVEFVLKEMGDQSVLFENLQNSYPTRIMYRRDGEALIARIEGKRGGSDASEEWRFSRVP